MDKNRLEGSARNFGGKEGTGRATGDTKSKVDGAINQAAGTAQNLYGQSADVARQTASTFDSWLRNQIETKPYTTAIAALGIGWLARQDAATALRTNRGANPRSWSRKARSDSRSA